MKRKFIKAATLSIFCISILAISNSYAENNFDNSDYSKRIESYRYSDDNRINSRNCFRRSSNSTWGCGRFR